MFGGLKTRWDAARGTYLKTVLNDTARRMSALPEPQGGVVPVVLDYYIHFFEGRNGPVANSPVELRKALAKELMAEAQGRFNTDPARSYALAIFSMHLESSALPGEDALEVFEATAGMIAHAVNLVAANKPA